MGTAVSRRERFWQSRHFIAAVIGLLILIPPVCAAEVPAVGDSGPVSPYQTLMNDAAANHNSAIQNMQRCSYTAALQNADRITSDGNSIYSTWGQHDQGRILLTDANNIRSAVSSLKNGHSVTFPDIVNNRNIPLSPCSNGNPTMTVTVSPPYGEGPDTSSVEDLFNIFAVVVATGLILIVLVAAAVASRKARSGGSTRAGRPKHGRRGSSRFPGFRPMPASYGHAPAEGPLPGGGETTTGPPPSLPSPDGGHPLEDRGKVAPTPPLHPGVSGLQVARVGNLVRMDWTPPAFDRAQEQLIGYEVFRSEPVSWSTQPQRTSLGTVGPDVRNYTVPYLDGSLYYNVRPIYRTYDGHILFGPPF